MEVNRPPFFVNFIYMKPRLIILSDLWGKHDANWVKNYSNPLSNYFDIHFYDTCELAEIDTIEYIETKLHQQFVNGGIEKAVINLIEIEKNEISILAFSIGGTIAWKAGIAGLKINKLIALSSTRLRYEEKKPKCNIQLIYGDLDKNKPTQEWLSEMAINTEIIPNVNHDFYKTDFFIESFDFQKY